MERTKRFLDIAGAILVALVLMHAVRRAAEAYHAQ
jgi:hypothetical protein